MRRILSFLALLVPRAVFLRRRRQIHDSGRVHHGTSRSRLDRKEHLRQHRGIELLKVRKLGVPVSVPTYARAATFPALEREDVVRASLVQGLEEGQHSIAARPRRLPNDVDIRPRHLGTLPLRLSLLPFPLSLCLSLSPCLVRRHQIRKLVVKLGHMSPVPRHTRRRQPPLLRGLHPPKHPRSIVIVMEERLHPDRHRLDRRRLRPRILMPRRDPVNANRLARHKSTTRRRHVHRRRLVRILDRKPQRPVIDAAAIRRPSSTLEAVLPLEQILLMRKQGNALRWRRPNPPDLCQHPFLPHRCYDATMLRTELDHEPNSICTPQSFNEAKSTQ